jgi:tetratricopeptide (TPR) repeat protein
MEKRINNVANWVFIISAFLIPLIFSASAYLAFPFAKILPFFIATFITVFLFILHVFNQGRVSLPTNWLFASILLVPLVYILSAFLSIHPSTSFLGTGVELGTASTITGLFLFMALISYFMRAKDKAFNACLAFVAAYVLLALFHIPRFIFGAEFLSFGVFNSVISNTVGRFTDLALISGIVTLLALTSIEFLRISKVVRLLSYVVLAISLVMLGITNFPLFVWGPEARQSLSLFTFVGFFALTFFVYFVSSSYGKGHYSLEAADNEGDARSGRHVPIASLIVLVVSVVFTFGALPLQTILASAFKIEPITETRLLWQPTAELSGSTMKDFPVRTLVGYGPDQFAYKWMLDKPAEINNSIVWNSAFNVGSGFIPSTPVTVGLIGFLAWVMFLVFLAKNGAEALFAKNKDTFSQYITVSSFLVSVYLWIAAVVYVPSLTTFILTFFFSGLFLASLFREKIIKEREFIFDNSKAKSFVSIMALIVLLLLVLFWGYKIGERVAASIYANRANVALSTAQSNEDVEKVKVYLRNAGSLANEDLYSRVLANLTLAQVNGIVQDTASPQEELTQRFSALYPEAVSYAQNAVSLNPKSFDNFITYGNVLEVGTALKLEGYYEGAKAAYEEAGKLNPKSPLIPYLLARLEVDNENAEGAKTRIGEALQLKPAYLEAIIFLGRIQIAEGRNEDALASFLVAQSIDPTNQDIQAVITLLRNGGATPNVPAENSAATSTATTTAQ